MLTDTRPIVEDDQDIGEPDGSVTINIGRAIIGFWLTIVTGAAFGSSAAKWVVLDFCCKTRGLGANLGSQQDLVTFIDCTFGLFFTPNDAKFQSRQTAKIKVLSNLYANLLCLH